MPDFRMAKLVASKYHGRRFTLSARSKLPTATVSMHCHSMWRPYMETLYHECWVVEDARDCIKDTTPPCFTFADNRVVEQLEESGANNEA